MKWWVIWLFRGCRGYIHLFVKSTLRLLVLTFEDLDKSTMVNVFFRIANLNNNYPKVEYSQAGFLEDTDTILNWSGNGIFDIAGLNPSGLQPGFRVCYPWRLPIHSKCLTFVIEIEKYLEYQKHTSTKFWWEILSVDARIFDLTVTLYHSINRILADYKI